MVEIFCSALSDGEPGFQVTYENMVKRPSNICQFFLVLNPDGFAGSDRYGARVAHIAEVIGKAKPMAGAAAPRLPGARGHAVKRKADSRRHRDVRQPARRAQERCRHDRKPDSECGVKAYEVREATGLDGLVLNRERADPQPGHGQIVVRVRAASLNYRDQGVTQGIYGYTKFPVIPLSDGAGEVAAKSAPASPSSRPATASPARSSSIGPAGACPRTPRAIRSAAWSTACSANMRCLPKPARSKFPIT